MNTMIIITLWAIDFVSKNAIHIAYECVLQFSKLVLITFKRLSIDCHICGQSSKKMLPPLGKKLLKWNIIHDGIQPRSIFTICVQITFETKPIYASEWLEIKGIKKVYFQMKTGKNTSACSYIYSSAYTSAQELKSVFFISSH